MTQTRLRNAHHPSMLGPMYHTVRQDHPYRIWLIYETGSGNKMDMVLDMWILDRSCIPTVTEQVRAEACGPCKGRNGGCPGYSPPFEKYLKSGSGRAFSNRHFR